MKTAISIPAPEFEAAEKLAKRLGMSRSELYQAAIADFLARHAEERVTDQLNGIYASESEAAPLSEVLKRMQAKSIPEEKW